MNNSEIKAIARNFYESYTNHSLDKSFNDYIAINLRVKWKNFFTTEKIQHTQTEKLLSNNLKNMTW